MKSVVALFLSMMLGAAAAIGFAVWAGQDGHHDTTLRAIHYDTQYDLSAQRRMPTE